MMLVCAATQMEMRACLASIGLSFQELPQAGARPWVRRLGKVTYAVTGVGTPITMSRLTSLLTESKPGLILNLGIAGAYPGSGLALGEVVAGESEVFGDLGMQTPDAERFLPLAGFPWSDEEYRLPLPLTLDPLRESPGNGDKPDLRAARGCTVNACTGLEETGKLRREIFGADFETMEGAAVAWAGREAGIPVCEVRAISNHASTRDFRSANVETALANLRVYMGRWLGRNA